jgi:hypothetical protein
MGATVAAAGVVVFWFAAGNFVVCPLIEFAKRPLDWRMLPVFVLIGAIGAQAALLSAVLVFGNGRFWARFACCWAVGALLWSCWAAGLLSLAILDRRGWSSQWREWLWFGALALPLAALAVQAPLWLARGYLGWRLMSPRTAHIPDRALSIRDFFIGTVVVAVSVTCARVAQPISADASAYWFAWAIALGCFAGVGLLGIVPALLAMFRLPDWRIGVFLLVLYGLVAGAAVIGTLTAIFGSPGGPSPQWQLLSIVLVFVSLGACLGIAMKVARDLGFQLVIGSRSSTPP